MRQFSAIGKLLYDLNVSQRVLLLCVYKMKAFERKSVLRCVKMMLGCFLQSDAKCKISTSDKRRTTKFYRKYSIRIVM